MLRVLRNQVYSAWKPSACYKRRFASSVLHSCNEKTQICVTGPQCVNLWTRHAVVTGTHLSWRQTRYRLARERCSVAGRCLVQ